jgi:hypothetical protein
VFFSVAQLASSTPVARARVHRPSSNLARRKTHAFTRAALIGAIGVDAHHQSIARP